jgi:hypothetical protein
LLARNVALVLGMSVSPLGCRGCEKAPAAQGNDDEGRLSRKPRVELTVGLGSSPGLPADAIILDPQSPPTKPLTFERSGITVAVVGIPPSGDAASLMKAEVAAAYAAGASALVFVSTRCLADLEPILTKDIAGFWTVPLVIGARCDGAVQTNIGAAALVAVGTASRVTITFERTTRAFLKVQPLP